MKTDKLFSQTILKGTPDNAVVALQGSSVAKGGTNFRIGSDLDIALAHADTFDNLLDPLSNFVKRNGKGMPDRIGPIRADMLEDLGMRDMAAGLRQTSTQMGRDTSFMVFRDQAVMFARGESWPLN